ncbi:Protein of unknown function [Pustulibacterium marinum]|uniref:Hypervirulence associated protein TUDOR domain-containing protein n=1 Tax=Pustulibacterium marinum TaxID=1224947 RepID=A0A1I7G0M6_9FLAO|nr:DUF2945 domain-containing protein [Pustulibacterium marinum]SFU41995.1 Protein of unknown function [Pustulibacterium marinum]
MAKFNEDEKVHWKWGNGKASGKVQSVFEKKTTRKINGSEITKNGSKDNPAYYIKQDDGASVLKLESELQS